MNRLRYRPELSARDRTRSLLATGALHLGLLLLLFLGLSVGRPPLDPADIRPPTLDLFDVPPLPPPLPDEVEGGPPRAEDVVPRQVTSRPTADMSDPLPQTAIVHTPSPVAPPAPSQMAASPASSGTNSDGNGLGSGLGGDGIGQSGKAGVGIRARRLAGYIASADYPAAAIAARAKGTTGAMLTINPAGRVGDCRVIASSGHGELDATVCRLARERFRYRPARDSAGRATSDSLKEYFTWVLPR